MTKYINILILTLFICACYTIDKDKHADFINFQKSIKNFPNFYKLGDTIISSKDDLWANRKFIDTTFLIKFQLIDTSYKTEYKPHTLTEYHCSLLGHYHFNNSELILTYSLRTEAGDGNPILTLLSFSEKGEQKGLIKVDLHYQHDPETIPVTYFSISPTFEIFINQTEKDYIFDKDKYTLTDSHFWMEKYKIGTDGDFLLIKK